MEPSRASGRRNDDLVLTLTAIAINVNTGDAFTWGVFMAKKVKTSGPTRMRELGSKLVQVWLDPAEWLSIKAAADEKGMKLATYVRRCAFAIATGRKEVCRYG